MGTFQNLQNKAKNLSSTLTQPFHILTITLLSNLLPLSFLLLARLSCYSYLLAISSYPTDHPPSSFLFSLILHTSPSILYLIVSIFGIATLLHGLTGKIIFLSQSPGELHRPGLYTAWMLLCLFQICVGLGIEGSIAAGIEGHSFDIEKSLISRVVFFVGLHETVVHWSRSVVKPVVDDTVFGLGREENWVQRVSIAMGLGFLWWWRLRDEVESLAIVAEAKREMLMGVGLGDFLGWWLYYLTVTIGMVRIVKTLMWVVMIFFCRKARRNVNSCQLCGNEDKV